MSTLMNPKAWLDVYEVASIKNALGNQRLRRLYDRSSCKKATCGDGSCVTCYGASAETAILEEYCGTHVLECPHCFGGNLNCHTCAGSGTVVSIPDAKGWVNGEKEVVEK